MPQIKINGLNVKPTKNNSWKVGIFTKDKEEKEVWINGFLNNHPTWQKGDTVELDVYHDEKWGMQFKLPEGVEDIKQLPNESLSEERFLNIEKRLLALENGVDSTDTTNDPKNATEGQNKPPTAQENEDIKVEDLPF